QVVDGGNAGVAFLAADGAGDVMEVVADLVGGGHGSGPSSDRDMKVLCRIEYVNGAGRRRVTVRRDGRKDQAPKRAWSIASAARSPWASPPAGPPGRSWSFQAYPSTCAHAWPAGTNRSRYRAAAMLPAILDGPELAMSATWLVR